MKPLKALGAFVHVFGMLLAGMLVMMSYGHYWANTSFAWLISIVFLAGVTTTSAVWFMRDGYWHYTRKELEEEIIKFQQEREHLQQMRLKYLNDKEDS